MGGVLFVRASGFGTLFVLFDQCNVTGNSVSSTSDGPVMATALSWRCQLPGDLVCVSWLLAGIALPRHRSSRLASSSLPRQHRCLLDSYITRSANSSLLRFLFASYSKWSCNDTSSWCHDSVVSQFRFDDLPLSRLSWE